jgi:UDP-2,4-diacetamido-2,4,6-trideoxy-beta-L-altropyranose hydrolase
MNITFRTDASLQIGTGHAMRCLTLAEALRASGAQCHFICREQPGNLIAHIRQRGFTVCVLPTVTEDFAPQTLTIAADSNCASWLGVDWTTDAAQTKVGVGGTVVDWLIVDHYALDARWEQTLRPLCRKLMVIDDLADRPHNCDLLLDQNLGRDVGDYSQLVPEGCTVLTGPHYALLRPEFAALRDDSLRRRAVPQIKHLLITMGGVDQANATGKVLEALQDCPLPEDMRITVAMGPHAPWLEHVQLLAKQMSQPAEVTVNVNNMAQLMSDSDFAIGAAGSTSWELFCLGLPTFLVVTAENQANSAAHIAEVDAAIIISIFEIKPRLFEVLSLLATSNEVLRRLTDVAKTITDGAGCNRVIEKMFP